MKPEEFLKLIPEEILERGRKLRKKGQVLELQRKEDIIEALVKGSYYPCYEVRVKVKGQKIADWECTCPYEGEVCKHVAAVILEAFSLEDKKEKGKKRKSKIELAEEIVDQLSFDELKQLVKDELPYDLNLRNALLARFSFYADLGTKTLEAKYNAIFRHLLSSYQKQGFIDYYATIEFSQEVERLLSSAKKLLEQGQAEEALVIAKTVMRNWVKNLDRMDDSSGATSLVLQGVLDLFIRLYRSGRKEVFDFLLEEGRKELYWAYGREYDFAEALTEMADSPEKARRVLAFLDTLTFAGAEKARLLLKFFPEEYEKFVRESISNVEVAEFHLKELLKREAYEEALDYVNLALSHVKIPRRKEGLWNYKALILKQLGRRKEALQIYYRLFVKSFSLDFLWKVKELASEGEWKAIKGEVRKLLKGLNWVEFLFEEGDYEELVKELKRIKEEVPLDVGTLRRVVSMLKKLPRDLGRKAGEAFLESASLVLEGEASRKLYRDFLSSLKPLWELVGQERMRTFLQEVVERYPARRALKEEVEKYLKAFRD